MLKSLKKGFDCDAENSLVVGVLGSLETVFVNGWGNLAHYAVYERYLQAIFDGLGASAVIIPTLSGSSNDENNLRRILKGIDGVVLPGGSSNVHSKNYGADIHIGTSDVNRDSLAFKLIRQCIDLDIPLLGICRGMQELNVALGGTLYQDIGHSIIRHHSLHEDPIEKKYFESHVVNLTSEGAKSFDVALGVYKVNSLHKQAIDQISRHLRPDAYSSDGLIEAVSLIGINADIFGVQWHPEWYISENDLNKAVWRRFQAACIRKRLATVSSK